MRSNFEPLGKYIRKVNIRNENSEIETLKGINIDKEFMPSVANTIGSNMTRYRVVSQWQFAYNPMHVGRDEVLPISMLKDDSKVIVSPAYTVFEIIDHNQLNPEYLMMWCRRSEFDRNVWFTTDNSVRGGFSWESLCEMELPIPPIEKQREIVAEYNTVVDRIELNERINQKLEETAKAIYRQWFEEFEFPISKEYAESSGKPEMEGKPYKSSGGEMVYNEELDMEIPAVCNQGVLSDLVDFSVDRIPIEILSNANYISTSNMLSERGGIEESTSLPNLKTVAKFGKGNILISNIRPYFKKIWLSTFVGGCSNDILCFVPKENISSIYIYFLLENDYFFDYVMRGAKGTKMPRGDKKWIMNFPLAKPNAEITNKFSSLTISLNRLKEEKIGESELLRSISKILLSKMSVVANVTENKLELA